MSQEKGVPILHWEKHGDHWFGTHNNRVLAIIAKFDAKLNKHMPNPAYDIQFPEKMFLTEESAKEYAQSHKRCEDHGIFQCPCVAVD